MPNKIAVHTQQELDAALAAKTPTIYIDSPAGVWLTLTDTGSSRVEAWDSSRVEARGSSRVVARGSSRVEAGGSSRVVARDSSRVEAWDSSSVVAWDSSSVVAWGSSRVVARGSSRVEAWGSSRVEAWDSSSVVAWDSSSVVAWGSSRVVARDSSRVVAGKYVAVHLWSARVNLTGGVLVDLTNLDLTDRTQWLDYHGVKVQDSHAVVYKAVDQDFNAGHNHKLTQYAIGSTVTAPDWNPTAVCGAGLHFGITPNGARGYYTRAGEPRFLACSVPVEHLTALNDKCKAKTCEVLYEVDIHGEPVSA